MVCPKSLIGHLPLSLGHMNLWQMCPITSSLEKPVRVKAALLASTISWVFSSIRKMPVFIDEINMSSKSS